MVLRACSDCLQKYTAGPQQHLKLERITQQWAGTATRDGLQTALAKQGLSMAIASRVLLA